MLENATHPVLLLDSAQVLPILQTTVDKSATVLWNVNLQWAAVIAIVTLAISSAVARSSHANNRVDAPLSGWSWPSISRVQFFFKARDIMMAGYTDVKGGVYKLCGGEMLVLPNKYVEEIRRLPSTKANAIQAAIDNFQGVYSATDVLAESELHSRVIQRNLTPKLNVLVPLLRDELGYGIEKEFPDCKQQWARTKAFPLMLHLISRLASRLFVGAELCRDEDWLETSRGYTDNVFKSIIFLRLFPPWLKPLMSYFNGPSWQTMHFLRKARKILVPRILAQRAAEEAGHDNDEKPKLKFDNLLQSMNDNAVGNERIPTKLAQRTLILTLASSHTTSMATCQALFDICDRPEYIPSLRTEIEQAMSEDGGWRKTTLTKLRKLDSFVKESQRFNPPSLLGFKRAIMEPLTLSDGMKLPKGAHVLMAINPIQFEDPRLEQPEVFDGYRYYKMRQNPENANRFQLASTDAYNLHFGHGAHACPGRFLATNVIKLIIAHLLMNYDMRFPDGQGRPPNVAAHEYSFPNPEGVVEFKLREDDTR